MTTPNACRRDGCSGRYLADVCHACGHGRDPEQYEVARLNEGYRLTERPGMGRLYYAQATLALRRDPLIR